ncbi:hypothetical protein [Paenibacillus prosopidis]|uniref:Uncharacterized protein n=1 Tax=Paenibacillus prosopidis TaxID=630520 RepID=A0A368W6S0_9BACL|nr:hypothetical protein [Paenibacillus prosopidis]RCW51680.1 hypothetical protein DFP97_10120 [Paenibacillus prosopidis]
MLGTFYIINGLIIGNYSSQIILELLKIMNINQGTISVLDINEIDVSYSSVYEYNHDLIETYFNDLEELQSIKIKNFIYEINSSFELQGERIPIRIINSIHVDNTYSIEIMFEYGHLQFEENEIIKAKKNEVIILLCKKIYCTGFFLYGFCGEEVSNISLQAILNNEEHFPATDAYFSKTVINDFREKELMAISDCEVNLCSSSKNLNDINGFFVHINEIISDNTTNVKYDEWLLNLEEDIKYKFSSS